MEIKLTIEATGLERAMVLLAEAIGYHTVTQEKKSGCGCGCKGVNENVTPAAKPEPTFIQEIPADEPTIPNAPLATQPVLAGIVPPAIPVVPTTAPTFSLEQLAVAGTQLMDAGHQDKLLSLLSAFGVSALTQLGKDQYGAFATQLRALGAKI